jgi:lysophospholipase L1-like esterase
MIHEPINGHIQMEEVGERPSVITMQAGGNNAGFYDVASNCIFHDADKDYGAAFPEQGECTAAIERAHNYLTNPNQDHWLEFDVKATIQEIFDKELAKSNPDFRLYIIGYAHFFDVRDDATWCDDFTFNLPWHLNQRQNLKLDLRKQINGLVEDLNQGLRRSAESFGNNKIGYIDVSSGFDGGRFCEVGHNAWDQFFGPKVLLWNWLGSIVTEVNGVDEEREPSQEEFDNWLKTGKFTNDPNEITEGEVAIQSPKQGNSPGSALRPFHPKAKGHEVMAKAIIERFKKDLAPAPPLCTNADCCPSGCTCGPSGVPLCT